MRRIVDIGRRIELIPIDPHFHDITIGLYRQHVADTTTGTGFPAFFVHTYSQMTGATERIAEIAQAMQITRWYAKNPRRSALFPL